MWVETVSAWMDGETGKRYYPGDKVNVTKDRAKSLETRGLAIPTHKRKGPSENKAKIPPEDKGAAG